MQKSFRINENQFYALANKAKSDVNTKMGPLWKRSPDTGKWQQRFFVLYQNFLFYYEMDKIDKTPSGVALLEGSYCERMSNMKTVRDEKNGNSLACQFCIHYSKEGQRHYDLKAETESEATGWIESIVSASYSKLCQRNEELEEKQAHLVHILDLERQTKWHYIHQTEELAMETKKLRAEISNRRVNKIESEENNDEIRKIKKVQSLFRGWICRRRWKQIVEQYIRSEHADSMRKRNKIVFSLFECEEEYVQHLKILISCFLRPFKMAASSKKPIISHEDVNSIYLNSETILFLHQFFLQGLRSKMESWPTLQLGDLFDMLLPMLSIYQEYVRNHHYSLQVLSEYKQKIEFTKMLRRCEEKLICDGRSLESFLTYPMHQIPRYIVTLHELLAHTPHDHVDKKKLEYAKSKLEDLSHIMHDEVSDTENIRKNLSIERMIVDGCDVLLDANQVFVRQGTLIQVSIEKAKTVLPRLSSSTKDRKENVRQVFLFTNHLLIATRTSNGKLKLMKGYGKIPLTECSLVENFTGGRNSMDEDNVRSFGEGELCDQVCNSQTVTSSSNWLNLMTMGKRTGSLNINNQSTMPSSYLGVDRVSISSNNLNEDKNEGLGAENYFGLDFKIIQEAKNGLPRNEIWFIAGSLQEKASWCSDISQCIEQLNFLNILSNSKSIEDSSTMNMPHSVRSDSKLFNDDHNIKFSQTFNSCRVPHIRHATLEKLLERLLDTRFLSIDFLNTFLLTYRVFTTGDTVVKYLIQQLRELMRKFMKENPDFNQISMCSYMRSPLPSTKEPTCEMNPESRSTRKSLVESSLVDSAFCESNASSSQRHYSLDNQSEVMEKTLSDNVFSFQDDDLMMTKGRLQANFSALKGPSKIFPLVINCESIEPQCNTISSIPERKENTESPGSTQTISSDIQEQAMPADDNAKPICWNLLTNAVKIKRSSILSCSDQERSSGQNFLLPNHLYNSNGNNEYLASPILARAGGVVTSSRRSKRRSSNSLAYKAFAAATAASENVNARGNNLRRNQRHFSNASAITDYFQRKSSEEINYTSLNNYSSRNSTIGMLSSKGSNNSNPAAAIGGTNRMIFMLSARCVRILDVAKHWIAKYPLDFFGDSNLRSLMQTLIEDLICCPCLLMSQQKSANNLLMQMLSNELLDYNEDVDKLLEIKPIDVYETFDTLSALVIAEQMTYLDYEIFRAIRNEELLDQNWMKPDKENKARNVLSVCKRFNEMSQLVVSEIISREDVTERALCIEKWVAIADICRCMQNFNGVLQICAALVNSSIFRLKTTWKRVSRQTKQCIERLKALVSSDGRFKSMREALKRCDPPCIPYLGMYLTDLSFIEEGSLNFTEKDLINFSKMRMIAHIIREIKRFHQTPYIITKKQEVINYLLDLSKHYKDDSTYKRSLEIEPRASISKD